MSDRSWKVFERRLARALGTRRIPVTGERAGADLQDGRFAYQAKLGRRFPAYLLEWLSGIVAAAARTGHIGVVVWKPKRVPDAEAVVLLRFADWAALHVGTPTTTPRQRLATLPLASICARPGCGQPLPATQRRHGSPRRFCSDRCRLLAWRTAHPEKSGAAA